MLRFKLNGHKNSLKKGNISFYKNYYWFTLIAKNGRILMTSEMYKTKRNALKGMAASACGHPYVFIESMI